MNDDRTELQQLAMHMSEQAVEGRRTLFEQHSSSFKWLMGSFLALNGGGLLSLKDMPSANEPIAVAAAVAFFLGIVASLAIAWLGQRSNTAMIEPITKVAIYWRSVAVSGSQDEAFEKTLDKEIEEATKGAKLSSLMGWVSLAFFAAGLTFSILSRA